ncbi:UNVERIFIED_CONTAM: hypothetical protein FKN15_020937 [Acipenser sinensis]
MEQARGEEPLLPEPRGEEPPLPEPRGEEPPPEPEQVRELPPPQPQPPPVETSPALSCVVPCPGIVDTLPECPDLHTLDLAPRSQHCQAQLFAWSLSQLPLKPQTSRHGSQTSLALPLPPTVFPLRLQTSLCRSTASHLCLPLSPAPHLCLPFLAPGHRPALQSPRASRPGPSSPVLGPFQEAPEGPTHPQARPWKRAKIDICGLEGSDFKTEEDSLTSPKNSPAERANRERPAERAYRERPAERPAERAYRERPAERAYRDQQRDQQREPTERAYRERPAERDQQRETSRGPCGEIVIN